MDEQLQLQEGSTNELDEGVRKRCKAFNARGDPCAGWVMGNTDWCWVHNPANQEAVDAARRQGGRANQAKHSPRVNAGRLPTKIRTFEDLLEVLDYCTNELLILNNGLSRNKAIVQLVEAYIKIIEKGEFADHVSGLEDKVGELKSLVERTKDPRRWR